MSTPLRNHRIRLASRPHGEPGPEDFRRDVVEVPSPQPGQVLLRTRYLSLDPYVRGRMSAAKSYAAPMEVGDVIVGGTVSEVVESRPTASPPVTRCCPTAAGRSTASSRPTGCAGWTRRPRR